MAIAESYASVADIEARVGLGVFGASTRPTLTQATAFAVQRAGELFAILSEVLGSEAPGPISSTIYIIKLNVSTSGGYALSQLLSLANAIGAAADCLEAAGAGEVPQRSERVTDLLEEYGQLRERISGMASSYPVTGVVDPLVVTHLSSGLVSPVTSTTAVQAGVPPFSSTQQW